MADTDGIDMIPLEDAMKNEDALRRQLRQLQKQVRRAKTEVNAREHESRLRRQAEQMKAELGQKDLHDALAGFEPADSDAARRFAEQCNVRLCELEKPEMRSWIRLFRRVDSDGSGLISFDEFVALVRDELGLSEAQLDGHQLKRTWLALDADRSGRVTAGEFGRFMRMGEHVLETGRPHWRERLHARRRAGADEKRKEKDRIFHRHIVDEVAQSGLVASADDVRRLSEAFSARINELSEHDTSPIRTSRSEGALQNEQRAGSKGAWYKLFKRVDTDGSGQIDFGELRRMVRFELQIRPSHITDGALKALWVALDTDGSGLISAGEFGQFIRLSEPPPIKLAERRERLADAARQEASAVKFELRRRKFSVVDQRRREYEQQVQATLAELAAVHADPSAPAPSSTLLPAIGGSPGGGADGASPGIRRGGPPPPNGKTTTVVAAYGAPVAALTGGLRTRVGGGGGGTRKQGSKASLASAR